jgi:hypothetical protein
MLTTKKAWELSTERGKEEIILWRGAHYKIDTIAPGRPAIGWTTLLGVDMKTKHATVLMIEGDEDINCVVAKDFGPQIQRARRMDNQRRRTR